MPEAPRQTISIPKATELLGVSRRTIYNWMAAGKVEYVRTAGGSVRIFLDTLWRHGDGRGVAPGETPRAAGRSEGGSAGRTRPGSGETS
jgi:excisionase family DNA binding protein